MALACFHRPQDLAGLPSVLAKTSGDVIPARQPLIRTEGIYYLRVLRPQSFNKCHCMDRIDHFTLVAVIILMVKVIMFALAVVVLIPSLNKHGERSEVKGTRRERGGLLWTRRRVRRGCPSSHHGTRASSDSEMNDGRRR
ncbi:hypothetical protein J6590_034423 [Homalodisca vitripennis]|nr:hypothetical protein J6590_034423 [Homalodisca vitripennis]